MHRDGDLVGERGEGALALLAQPGARAGRVAQLQRAQILAGRAQRQEDPRVSPLLEALAGDPVRPLVRAAHDPHAALTQAAHRGVAAGQREPRILARLIAAGPAHARGDPGCPAAVVHQVEEGVVAPQRLGDRLEHARHGGLHGAGVQHGLADGPVRRAGHDVLQRAGRVLQEMQHVGQFARQLMRIAMRHVALDRHHADGPGAGGQRDHQPRLVRGAAQGIRAEAERLRLHAGRIVQVDRRGQGGLARWGINPLQPPFGRHGAIDAHVGQPEAKPQPVGQQLGRARRRVGGVDRLDGGLQELGAGGVGGRETGSWKLEAGLRT